MLFKQVKPLHFFLRTMISLKFFEEIGKQILENNKSEDILKLLDSGKVVANYASKGNEIVLGHYILDDPKTKKEAEEAIQRKEIFFCRTV